MLLALSYQRTEFGAKIDSQQLQEHFQFLKEHYPIVLPGDPLAKRKLSICLTFENATFDFYHTIFPILQKFQIKALLGVVSHYIIDTTNLEPKERLSVPYPLMMQDGFYDKKVPFCTWKELEEMMSSGLVEIASHSYSHCNLTFDFVDLNREVVRSKELIESKLAQPVSSFIYPFGKMTLALQEYIAEHYLHAFFVGSTLNFGWGNGKKPLNSIAIDITHPAPLSFFSLMKAFTKTLLT